MVAPPVVASGVAIAHTRSPRPEPQPSPRERPSKATINPNWLDFAFAGVGERDQGPRVGAANDPLEREADVAADRVLAGGDAPALSSSRARVQRECADCEGAAEDEPMIQREASATGADAGRAPAAFGRRLAARENAGRPLDAASRAYFEPRFQTGFADVRLHDDGDAQRMTRAVGARAFTYANHIYRAPSGHGTRTLAHELSHVVQQRAGGARIQRERDPDFTITDLHRSRASQDDRIFFEYDSAALSSGERTRLEGLATSSYSGKTVKLFGRASEEGDPAYNARLAQRRINAVARVLRAEGVNVYDTEVRASDGLGQIDYRFQRSVEIRERPTPTEDEPEPVVTSTQNPCAGDDGAARGDDLTACNDAFEAVYERSRDAVDAAYTRLSSGAADDERDRVLGDLFNGVDPATVTTNMKALRDFIRTLRSHYTCRNACDARCTRGAMGSSGSVKLCVAFVGRSDRRNTKAIIHESAHATPSLTADDVAYSSARLFQFLDPSDAVRNTDSYALLALVLGDSETWSYAPRVTDTLPPSVTAAPEQRRIRGAVAWLENWLNYCDFDTGLTYDFLLRSEAGWSTGQTNDTLGRTMMDNLAPLFGLTDPDAATQPTFEDRTIMAALHDRYDRMYSVVRRPLEIAMSAEGDEHWEPQGGLTGAGSRLWVPPSMIASGANSAANVKLLLRILAKAFHDISDARAVSYAEAGDHIRQYRRMGPS